jgi:geranylgeranyl pyrophosphate synthase
LDLFGIENSPESVLIVMLNPKKEEVEEIKELMKDSTALEWNEENLEKVQNVEKIQKIYKVSTNFKEEIISKLAIRDL